MHYSPFMRTLYILLCALIAAPAHAEIYRWVDKDGNVHFTDQAREGAKAVELNEPTVFPGMKPAAPAATGPESATPDEQPAEAGYERFLITSPANEVNIWTGEGRVEVDVDLAPALREGHRLVLNFNGSPVSEGFSGGRLVLNNVERGTHRLVAEIRDGSGNVLRRSEPVVFHLKRPTIRKQPR